MLRLGSPIRVLRVFPALLVLVIAASAQVPPDFKPQLALLRSPQARGSLTVERATLALWYAAADFGLPAESLPSIILVHGCPYSGKVANLVPLRAGMPAEGTAAAMEEKDSAGRPVYYLWIIGDNTDFWLARGLVTILGRNAGEARQEQAVQRVLRKLSATVSASTLKSGTHAEAANR